MIGRQVDLLDGSRLHFQLDGIQRFQPSGKVHSFPYPRAERFASLLVLAAREREPSRILSILDAYRLLPSIREQIVIANPGLDPSPFHEEPALKWVTASSPEDILPTSLKGGLRALSRRAQQVILALANRPLLPAASLLVLLRAATDSPDRIIVPLVEGERSHPLILPRAVIESLIRTRKEKGLLYYVKRFGLEIQL
jgi:hypothetical protein